MLLQLDGNHFHRGCLVSDFVSFSGDVNDPIDNPVDPTKWTLLKSGADNQQMLFDTPLTEEQLGYLALPVTSVDDEPNAVPDNYELIQNYPNPFNPGTTIEFRLPKATNVTLKIYNILGNEVLTVLNDKNMNAGAHKIPRGSFLNCLSTLRKFAQNILIFDRCRKFNSFSIN